MGKDILNRHEFAPSLLLLCVIALRFTALRFTAVRFTAVRFFCRPMTRCCPLTRYDPLRFIFLPLFNVLATVQTVDCLISCLDLGQAPDLLQILQLITDQSATLSSGIHPDR
jgi:hypothetical protein